MHLQSIDFEKKEASDQFLCVRDMYKNVDPNHCPSVTINNIISEEYAIGLRNENISELYFYSNNQYAKSSW